MRLLLSEGSRPKSKSASHGGSTSWRSPSPSGRPFKPAMAYRIRIGLRGNRRRRGTRGRLRLPGHRVPPQPTPPLGRPLGGVVPRHRSGADTGVLRQVHREPGPLSVACSMPSASTRRHPKGRSRCNARTTTVPGTGLLGSAVTASTASASSPSLNPSVGWPRGPGTGLVTKSSRRSVVLERGLPILWSERHPLDLAVWCPPPLGTRNRFGPTGGAFREVSLLPGRAPETSSVPFESRTWPACRYAGRPGAGSVCSRWCFADDRR
jgi:hypothetical protein